MVSFPPAPVGWCSPPRPSPGLRPPSPDGKENQIRHQAHGVAGRPVLAGFLAVLLVESADQFLEDGAHGVIVHRGLADRAVGMQDRIRAEIDLWIEELVDERAEGIGLREGWELVAEFEVLEDVLNILGESVQVSLKIGEELLLAAPGLQQIETPGVGRVPPRGANSISTDNLQMLGARRKPQLCA